MTHPLVPQILELARPVAAQLNFEVVDAVFHTHQNPPVLRVDIRNLSADTGLRDCETMSHAFEAVLDIAECMPDDYVLEVSSPGVSQFLSSDRDFTSFRGFPVVVRTHAPCKGHTEWEGSLIGRDDTVVRITKRGREIVIPKDLVVEVQLQDVTE
jgi:ribosome maturation factor RimP